MLLINKLSLQIKSSISWFNHFIHGQKKEQKETKIKKKHSNYHSTDQVHGHKHESMYIYTCIFTHINTHILKRDLVHRDQNMSICRRMQCNGFVVLMLVLVISSQVASAARPIQGDHQVWFHGDHQVWFHQDLQGAQMTLTTTVDIVHQLPQRIRWTYVACMGPGMHGRVEHDTPEKIYRLASHYTQGDQNNGDQIKMAIGYVCCCSVRLQILIHICLKERNKA